MTKQIVVNVENQTLTGVENIEEIICLAVLITRGILPVDSTNDDAHKYMTEIRNCDNCLACHKCLACIINE